MMATEMRALEIPIFWTDHFVTPCNISACEPLTTQRTTKKDNMQAKQDESPEKQRNKLDSITELSF